MENRIEKVKRFDAHVDRFTGWVATISFICVVISSCLISYISRSFSSICSSNSEICFLTLK